MRPRFSLRLLLIAFTLIALLFGAATHFVYRVKDQAQRNEAALKQLEYLNAEYHVLDGHPDDDVPTWFKTFARKWISRDAYPKPIDVDDNRVPPQVLNDIYRIRKLSYEFGRLDAGEIAQLVQRQKKAMHLELICEQIEPGAVAEFPQLDKLSLFRIEEPIDDSFARQLGKIKSIQTLSIDVSQLSDEGLKSLDHFPKLYDLTIHGNLDRPEHLAILLKSSPVQVLKFSHCQIADAALRSLENATRLTSIEFENCALPNDFSHWLAKAPKIKYLYFDSETPPSAAQLSELPNCPQLERIGVVWPKLTRENLFAFQLPSSIDSFWFPGDLENEIVLEFLKTAPRCEIEMHQNRVDGSSQPYRSFKMTESGVEIGDWVRKY